MTNLFSKLNMYTKIISLSVCTVLLTSLLLSALFYKSNTVVLEEKVKTISEETIVQANTYLDSEFTHIIQLVHGNLIGYDIYETVKNYLRAPSKLHSITIQEMLTQLVVQSQFIQSAQVIINDYEIGNLTHGVSYDLDPILEQATKSKSGIYWHDELIIDERQNKELLILVFDLTNTFTVTLSEDVFLVVNLSFDTVESALRSLESNVFGTVRLVNQDETPFFDDAISAEDYDYILTAESKITGWKIQTLQKKNVLFAEYYQTQENVSVAVLVVVLILVVINGIFAQSIVTPLRHLTRMAEKMQHQDYTQTYQVIGTSEIDLLGNAFNHLQEELIQYEQIVAHDKAVIQQEAQEKRIAELNLLQAQVNPHFLYNTLDSLYWYAHGQESERVCSIIISLSRLLRITLSKGDEYLSLEQEIQHLEAYLKIQKQIFDQKFDYEIQFDKALSTVRIVKIVLQPLVENSILHGFADIEENGHIWVNVFRDGDDVVLQVLDNGIGFTQSALKKKSSKGSGFALNNLRKRLALYYKERATLSYRTNAQGLTEVEIRLQPENEEIS